MSEKVNKKVFKTVVDGVDTWLAVLRPKGSVLVEAKSIYNKAWTRAVRNEEGIAPNAIMDVARKVGIWDDEKDKQANDVDKEITRLESIINKGKKYEPTDQEREVISQKGWKGFGKEVSLNLRDKRIEQILLFLDLQQLRDRTFDAIANREMMEYLVSRCTLWGRNEGREHLIESPFFENFSKYLERRDQECTGEAYGQFEDLFSDGDPDWQKSLPENKFLLKYGFSNDKMQLVDQDGNLVNRLGQKVDEDGNILDSTPVAEDENVVGDFDDLDDPNEDIQIVESGGDTNNGDVEPSEKRKRSKSSGQSTPKTSEVSETSEEI